MYTQCSYIHVNNSIVISCTCNVWFAEYMYCTVLPVVQVVGVLEGHIEEGHPARGEED